MKHARDENNGDFSATSKSSRSSDMNLIRSEENFKILKVKVTELNETFTMKVYSSSKNDIRNFPTYIELSSATSINTYNQHKSAIAQHLKNKPKYICNLTDKTKLQVILDYFANKKIMSLNMDHVENNQRLLSFMLSPYKDSVFYDDVDLIGHNSDMDFCMSLTAPITDEISCSLFFCKYTLYIYCYDIVV